MSTQKVKSWFTTGGRALLLLASVIAVTLAATGIIALVRRGQSQAYTPVNLMNGASGSGIVVSGGNTTITTSPTAVPAILLDGNAVLHIVQRGETLSAIARQYNLNMDEIIIANSLTNADTIYEGQELLIPVPSVDTTPQTVSIQPTVPVPTADLSLLKPPPMDVSAPTTVNGLSVDTFAAMPNDVIQHIRNIYAIGAAIGRNPRAFSKLGDSTIENPHFLTRFDGGPYNLGDFVYLQPVLTYFAGSFGRESVAVRRGLHTWSVFDPMWATGVGCNGGEDMLTCELRLQNPSILFIHLGSNDAGVPDSTERSLRQIIEYCLTYGVIPILGTKADRHEGSNINNEIIRRLATDYNVPLWDFDLVAATLPGRGLAPDGTHMTSFFAHDWSSPVAFERGYGLMNITALMMLDRVWRAVNP